MASVLRPEGGHMRSGLLALLLLVAAALAVGAAGCASDVAPAAAAPPPCDQLCKDGIVLRGLREQMKLVFNLTLQGKDVGAHDYTVPCPLGGQARIYGTATAEPIQGATIVDLTYDIQACTVLERDDDVDENYQLTVTGVITQKGTLAVQPTSTTALAIQAEKMTITGTIYDPPEPYDVTDCKVTLSQSGNNLTGFLCERTASVDL